MFDNEKIGGFLKELRIKHNLSQNDLAIKLYISRQAVSLWENGKTLPEIDKINDLANLYNVTIADIFAGEIIKDEKKKNEIVSEVIKLEKNRAKKIFKLSLLIIVGLIFMFLIYYFISYYRQVSVYLINVENDEKYNVNGVLIKSLNQYYFNLETDQKVDRICLKYINEDINKDIVCRDDSNFLVFKDYIGYEEYLDINDFDNFINHLYIKVDDDELKLDIWRNYLNDKLILLNEDEKNVDDNDINYFNDNIPKKIKNEFNYDKKENSYKLLKNNENLKIELIYFKNTTYFVVTESNNNIFKEWVFNYKDNIMEKYREIKNNTIIKEYKDFSNMDKDQEKIYNYFIKMYKNQYLT